jgi:hypothetical protein
MSELGATELVTHFIVLRTNFSKVVNWYVFSSLSIRPLGGWRRDTGLIVDKKLVLSYNKGSPKYVVSDSTEAKH